VVNREILQKRIEKLNEYLDFLNNIKTNYDKKEFKSSKKVYASTERFLHLSIEALLDIGNHLIADQNLGKVNNYSDIPLILFENNYLSEELKELFIKIIGFRNILVHDYLDIDLDIVYQILDKKLKDLEEIIKIFAKYL